VSSGYFSRCRRDRVQEAAFAHAVLVCVALAGSGCTVDAAGLAEVQDALGAAAGGASGAKAPATSNGGSGGGQLHDGAAPAAGGAMATDAAAPARGGAGGSAAADVAARDPAPPDAAPTAADVMVTMPGPEGPMDAAPPPPDLPPPPPDLPPPPPDLPPPHQALVLVGGDGPAPGDGAVEKRLGGLGFKVTVIVVRTEGDARDARQTAQRQDLVFLSSTLQSWTGMAGQFRDLPVPIICTEPELLDNLGLGQPGNPDQGPGEQDIAIVNQDHPLANGRSGVVEVTSRDTRFGWAFASNAAVRVAIVPGEPSHATILALEKSGGFSGAPARRVGWFALEPAFPLLNGAGWGLFDAAVKWATGGP
jgi:hypothetical protein